MRENTRVEFILLELISTWPDVLWVEGGRSIISSASSQWHLQIHAELTLSPQNSKRQLVSAFHLSLQGMLQDVSEVK